MTDIKLTPAEVRAIIKDRFPALLSSGMVEISYHNNIMTLSGSIIAVSALEKNVMRNLYPTHCKPPEIMEATKDKRATYTYKF